jgi:hypothetical protein
MNQPASLFAASNEAWPQTWLLPWRDSGAEAPRFDRQSPSVAPPSIDECTRWSASAVPEGACASAAEPEAAHNSFAPNSAASGRWREPMDALEESSAANFAEAVHELESIARRELARLLLIAGLRPLLRPALHVRSSVCWTEIQVRASEWACKQTDCGDLVAGQRGSREQQPARFVTAPGIDFGIDSEIDSGGDSGARRVTRNLLATRWHERARRLLRLSRQMGWTWAGLDWLERAAFADPASEPGMRLDPLVAAEAALSACDSIETRLWFASLHFEAGSPREALRACQELITFADATWPAHLTQQVWRGLADAHEACGNDRLALAACLAALRSGDRSPWPAQHGLVLALAIGDVARARACARWLGRICSGAAEENAVANDVVANAVPEREVPEQEVPERELSERAVSEREVSGREASGREASEPGSSERASSKRDSSGRDVWERDVTAKNVPLKDGAENGSAASDFAASDTAASDVAASDVAASDVAAGAVAARDGAAKRAAASALDLFDFGSAAHGSRAGEPCQSDAGASAWRDDLSLLRARVQRLRGPLPWRPAFRWAEALAGARDRAQLRAARRSHRPPSQGVENPFDATSKASRALARAQEVCQALT